MIDEVAATLRELGVEADRIHGEHFTVASTTTVGGAPESVAASASGAITVEFIEAPPGAIMVEFDAAPAGVASPAPDKLAGAPEAAEFEFEVTPDGASTPAEPAVAPDQAVVIVLMDGRRRTFNMRMNDEIVLDAALRAGLELPFSCRAGVCSTCRTKLVRGEVEMEQNYALEDWEVEQGYVLACQARVKTPVLELDYDEK
jgi:ring-1,2-phenylacetyl-CoA epoxidase subunit PaaE